MTPQQKAEELVDKFMNTFYKTQEFVWKSTAKHCVLIAVEEILNTLYSIPFGNALDNELEYWEEVKEEIKKS